LSRSAIPLITPLARYIKGHWRGEHSLGRSFWLNLVVLLSAILATGNLLKPPFIEYVGYHLPLAMSYAVIATLIIFPWQIMGVLRAGDRLATKSGASANVMFSQIGIAVAGLMTVASLYSIFQPLLNGPPEEPLHKVWERERASKYEITVSDDGRALAIVGEFELGLTRAVRGMLSDNPNVTVVMLESGGGFVSQGRALASVIEDKVLDTYVDGTCSSSCTIAFAAGRDRRIGEAAKLGFHRYNYADKTIYQTVDSETEQTRDRAYFSARGFSPAFLDRIFEAGHTDIWYPTTPELIEGGVIHGIAGNPFTSR